MLISTATCPLCQQNISGQETRCPHCQSVIQIDLQPPQFSRSAVVQQLVYPVLQNSRRQIALNQGSGYDFYVLGLGYLNYEMSKEGMELWSHAAALLPEQHRIHFELAMIHYTRGEYKEGLVEAEQAVDLAPGNRDYAELRRTLKNATVQESGDKRPEIVRWISTFERDPQSQAAGQALKQFVGEYDNRLTGPTALLLRTLDGADAARLWVLNDNPANRRPPRDSGPKPPLPLGTMRLALLRRVAPARAEAVEQMHDQAVEAHTRAAEASEIERRNWQARQTAESAQWQGEVENIRSDLSLMARLSVALDEEENRLGDVVERRKAEWEERRQSQALQEKIIQQTPRPTGAPTPEADLKEKRYLIARARYIIGLKQGHEGDSVAITVTDRTVTVYHHEGSDRWKLIVPTDMVVEAAEEQLRRTGPALPCLRISYLDANHDLQHVFFSHLDSAIPDAVRRIERAMGRTPVAPASGPRNE